MPARRPAHTLPPLVALLMAGLGAGCSPAPSARSAVASNLPLGTISAFMRHLESNGLSGALLIAEDGRVVLEEFYGLANRVTGRPVDGDTVFDIGSLSKQFTAAAILKLQEEGRLNVSDPLASHLVGVPEDKSEITLHQLLTHTAGLEDPQSEAAIPVDRDRAVRQLLSLPLESPPGAAYSYSNAGYSLLAAVVERASGLPFEAYLRSELYEPAGLRHTGATWERQPALEVAIGEGAYEGRFRDGDPRSRRDSWALRGSGNTLSTTRDLWRWMRALGEGRILSRESRALLVEPYTPAEADFLFYGYGWRIQKTARDTSLVWHSGRDEAFSAVLRHYVDEGVIVVFTTNSSIELVPLREVVLRSAREGAIGEILFDGRPFAPTPALASSPALLERLAGSYALEGGGSLLIRPVDGVLTVTPVGQAAIEALQPSAAEARESLDGRSRAALELAEGVRSPAVAPADERFRFLDPYGFAGVGAAELRAEWRRLSGDLGSLERFEAVGTSPVGLPGRESPVTLLRLHFENGTEDYRAIWYGDDETYLLNGAPRSFAKLLQRSDGLRFVHYDLLSSSSFTVEFVDRHGAIVGLRVAAEGVESEARREGALG